MKYEITLANVPLRIQLQETRMTTAWNRFLTVKQSPRNFFPQTHGRQMLGVTEQSATDVYICTDLPTSYQALSRCDTTTLLDTVWQPDFNTSNYILQLLPVL